MLPVRSIWNGAISFGLVSIPIKLVNATESHSVSFRQVHLEDGGRIRYRKVCELEDREVTQGEIGKAYEDADGTMIPITDEDLAALPIPTAKTIEIEGFVPAESIDPLQVDAAYYLAANGVPAAKPYTLLREALKRSGKVAICKFALRGRERLGMLRVVDDVLAMHGLLWPDEIRTTDGVAPDASVTVRDKELDLADALMDTLGEVDLDSLHDDYREAVEELIAAKASGEEPAAVPAPAPGGKVLDLMAALEKSVRDAKESRGEDVADITPLPSRPTPKQPPGKKSTTPARKTAASPKKSTAQSTQPAKKTAAKKATAKRTTATKTTATKSAAAKSTATKTTAAKTTAAKTTAKKTPAKKATSRKRSA
ncbi:Ku protein [Streptomyces europaeiscabiei]|uniref:non-homologous end joining protein Ku n=1 Tax=Streptomyces europaeiscabiei TaxID=146819 RepID=UPI0029BCC4E3|nr:Ku protein [Streptomyces europaeiscabiei]MDX3636494.1 Ku protein [Streptomyces europaeiscabiei]MDX3654579.1 Ku protein [Streptomyces europaeiscabiei]